MQIVLLCSLSQKPPELCIEIDAKVNLGFGALYVSETPVSSMAKVWPCEVPGELYRKSMK